MNVQLTRARFEKSAQNHLLRAKQNILDVLRTAQITQDQVNMVCTRRFLLAVVSCSREIIESRLSLEATRILSGRSGGLLTLLTRGLRDFFRFESKTGFFTSGHFFIFKLKL